VHVPDGFLSPSTYGPAYGIAGVAWVYCVGRVRKTLDEQTIPLLATVTALSFVLMMVAVPLPGGTTAHATGIALLALLFGVPLAFLAVSLVLLLQAVLLGEGGITSLPVGALAMGLAGSMATRSTFVLLRRIDERAALFIAGWFAVMVPAAVLALVLGIQPRIAQTADGAPLFFPFGISVTLPALLIPHAVLGIGEGVLTVLVYRIVTRLVPGGQFRGVQPSPETRGHGTS
jgi:cobalt/nickel transport system permease protein